MNSYQVAFKALCQMPKNFTNSHNRKYLLNFTNNYNQSKHKQVIVSIKGNSRIE